MKATPSTVRAASSAARSQADLLLERDGERVLLDRRLVGAVGGRPVVEPDAVAERGRAGPRDPDRIGRDPIGLAGRQAARAREAPRAVDEDADPEALALAGGDALDPPALHGDRFVAAVDDPHVGIRRAKLDGRIEGAVGEVAHRGGTVAEVSGRAGAFALCRPVRVRRRGGATERARGGGGGGGNGAPRSASAASSPAA